MDDQTRSAWGEHQIPRLSAAIKNPAEAGFFVCVFRSLIDALGSHYARGTQLDRVMQGPVTLAGGVHATVVNQTVFLQVFQCIRHRVFTPVIIQHLLAEAGWVSVEQTGEDFVFQCVIDGHIYLALLVS
jgi:hypothetical protein